MKTDREEEEEYVFILQFVRTNKKHGPFRNPFSRETEGRGERLLLSFLRTSDTLPSLKTSLASSLPQSLTHYLITGNSYTSYRRKRKSPKGAESEKQERKKVGPCENFN